jgi:ubiquinone/menaquinone biosynthesis C-methylase UbiE
VKPSRERSLVKQYDRIWEKFFEKSGYQNDIIRHRKNRKKYHEIVCRYINEKQKPRIVEIGCGTCIDTNLIAERKNSGNYFAIDISKSSISIISKIKQYFGYPINFLVGDTFFLPLKDKSFDLVFSQGLIEHFPNPKKVIKEQARILKKNGYLIINVPQRFTGYTLMKKKMIKEKNWELGREREFSYNNLKKLGECLGLTEIEVAGYQYWKSWKEPTFVLRDLYDKFHRRNPLKNYKIFKVFRNCYERFWKTVEDKWGYYFLQNIIIVFQKR